MLLTTCYMGSPMIERSGTGSLWTSHFNMDFNWLVANVAASLNEKYTTVRYIAGPPAVLRGTQPSQAIILVKPSASDALAAPSPDLCSECRASVCSGPARGDEVLRVHSWKWL